VLHLLADEMGASLGLPDVPSVRAEIARLGAAAERPGPPQLAAADLPAPEAGEAVLASWHWLLDDGSLQDGEPFLAGTAKKPRLHLSPGTAAEIGAAEGAPVTVASDRGSVTLPLVIADLPDRVVWVPMKTPDAAVRRDLAVLPGDVVRLSVDTSTAPDEASGSREGEV
jgi:NADH-quinone oxidoreductase subunit G